MIKEIEVSEVVSQLLSKSRKDVEVYKQSYLRQIGDYLEKSDTSYRVSLSKCAYNTFQSRNPRLIDIKNGEITVSGLKNPTMKALIHQYAPSAPVAQQIDNAVSILKAR